MKWEQLTKKGYEITNKRVLGNTSEETRNKDLIQELALVQEWIRCTFGIFVTITILKPVVYLPDLISIREEGHKLLKGDKILSYKKTPQEALISGIEYIINNLL